ncbi:peptide chain release factor N(5)-glutamine methyltransferase [soil metagenome]
MTITEYYHEFILKLSHIYDKSEATNIADWVIENITGIKRLDRVTNKHRLLSESEFEKLQNVLSRLLKYEPVQYVLNESWFYKMKFYVDKNVLIPRPETEELVEWIVEEYKLNKNKLRILEVGSGSGCIAIALKKQLPDVLITSVDISEDALKVARKNALQHQCDIHFLKIDFLNNHSCESLSDFDLIVSNPPYIPIAEKDSLNKNVTAFEPHAALFTEDNDPFIFYKKIAEFGKQHLRENGKIFVEMHEKYAAETENVFRNFNLKTELKKDLFGRDRMLCAYK